MERSSYIIKVDNSRIRKPLLKNEESIECRPILIFKFNCLLSHDDFEEAKQRIDYELGKGLVFIDSRVKSVMAIDRNGKAVVL